MQERSSTFTPRLLSDALQESIGYGRQLWKSRRHLLDTADLSLEEISTFLHVANACKYNHENEPPLSLLSGKTVATLFYETSTRTRSSFEVAAKRLGCEVLNLDVKSSSVTKGETITDTARQLASMRVNAIIQRHSASGSAELLANHLGDRVQVINAGDGWHAHPTQALLDLLTMIEHTDDISRTKIAIIGDITHSRVTRSNVWLLNKLEADVHLCGPPLLVPTAFSQLGVTIHSRLEPAIENADFIIMLRLQMERQSQGLIPSLGEYKRLYRMDHRRLQLAKPTAKVLHPGPINRDLEITNELANDGTRSLIDIQVANGVAARMAVLYLLLAEEGGGA